jgi:hypothetical protein
MSVGKGAESRLIIEISSDEPGGSLVRQAAEISSRLPGPVGSIHELVFARVARHGIVQAVAAAKRELEKR